MKKLICILLLIALALSLFSSCASDLHGDPAATGTPQSSEDRPGDNGNNGTETPGGDQPAASTGSIGNPSAIGAKSDADSILPTISIVTESGSAIRTKEYEGASVSVSGATVEDQNFEDSHAQIKCRGNFTYTGTDKKSYRVKFDEKINLFGQGRGPAKSWVLMAEHCDQSFLRNHLAFTMGALLTNISFVSSSSFVHLVINGEDQGIYHVAEQHQTGEYRVNINEDPDVIDTDYFIEWDAYADGEYFIDYFYVGGSKFLVKSDNEMSYEKCSFLSEYFNEAYEALQSGAQKTIEKYLDLPSFVDTYILQEIVKNIDVGWSSFFFVKHAGGKISCTCPWDFDLSCGNDARLDDGSYEGMYVGNSEYAFGWHSLEQGNEWLCYLMRQRWFVDMVYKRWTEISDTLKEAALGEIDRIYNCFGDEIASNFEIWKIFGRKINQEPRQIMDLKSYKAHVDYLRDWLENRFEWIDGYFSDKTTKYKTTEYKEWGGGWWNDRG